MNASFKHLFTLILCPAICLAQIHTDTQKKDLVVKINITSLTDVFSFPTVQLSLEKGIKNNFSLSGEFGYQFYDFENSDTAFISPSGEKANIELRCYDVFNKFKGIKDDLHKIEGMYFGLNLFYRHNKYNESLNYSTSGIGITEVTDCYEVDKTIWGSDLVFGYQRVVLKRIVLDGYTGIGAMNKTIHNYHREYNSEIDELYGVDLVPLFVNMNLSENDGLKFSWNLGIRMGVLF